MTTFKKPDASLALVHCIAEGGTMDIARLQILARAILANPGKPLDEILTEETANWKNKYPQVRNWWHRIKA